MRESPSSGDTWAKYERLSGKSPDLGVKQGLWKDFSGRGSIMCSGMEVWKTMALLEKRRSTGEELGIFGVEDRREPFSVTGLLMTSSPTGTPKVILTETEKGGPLIMPHTGVSHAGETTLGQTCILVRPIFYCHLRFERTWHKGPWLLSACLLCPNPLGSTFILCQYLLQVTSSKRLSSVMWSSSSYLPKNYLI